MIVYHCLNTVLNSKICKILNSNVQEGSLWLELIICIHKFTIKVTFFVAYDHKLPLKQAVSTPDLRKFHIFRSKHHTLLVSTLLERRSLHEDWPSKARPKHPPQVRLPVRR